MRFFKLNVFTATARAYSYNFTRMQARILGIRPFSGSSYGFFGKGFEGEGDNRQSGATSSEKATSRDHNYIQFTRTGVLSFSYSQYSGGCQQDSSQEQEQQRETWRLPSSHHHEQMWSYCHFPPNVRSRYLVLLILGVLSDSMVTVYHKSLNQATSRCNLP